MSVDPGLFRAKFLPNILLCVHHCFVGMLSMPISLFCTIISDANSEIRHYILSCHNLIKDKVVDLTDSVFQTEGYLILHVAKWSYVSKPKYTCRKCL